MQSSTDPTRIPLVPPSHVPFAPGSWDDDSALGCECANPVLQIDCWAPEENAALPRALD